MAFCSLFAGPSLSEVLLGTLPSVLPDYAVQVIARQIRHTSAYGTSEVKRLGITSALGFATLLVSTNRGTAALFRGLGVVYGGDERRGLVARLAASLAFTLGAIVFLVFSIGAVILLPGILRGLGWEAAMAHVVNLLSWPVILVVTGLAIALLYRFGPSRIHPDWRWIAIGSSAASLLWVGGSLLFSFVVSQLGRLDELYGSVGAMIGFMLWVWLSVIIVLIGAELDATAARAAKERDAAPAPSTGNGSLIACGGGHAVVHEYQGQH